MGVIYVYAGEVKKGGTILTMAPWVCLRGRQGSTGRFLKKRVTQSERYVDIELDI